MSDNPFLRIRDKIATDLQTRNYYLECGTIFVSIVHINGLIPFV